MKKKFLIVATAVCALLAACQPEETGPDAEPFLNVDRTELSFSNEAGSATFTITSNRSWEISQSFDCDWLTVEPMSYKAESENYVETVVTVTLDASTDKSVRTASLFIDCEDTRIDIIKAKISQAAEPARLDVTSPKILEGLSYEGDTLRIEIASNTSWEAKVKDGSTASVSLSSSFGSENATLTAVLARNLDPNEDKTATVVISCVGCEDVEVVLSQIKCPFVPSFEAKIPEKSAYVEPGVFSSLGGTRWIEIKSNVSWTAKVSSDTNASGVSIETESGSGDLDKFVISCGQNTTLTSRKNVVIEFTAENVGKTKVTLEQEMGSIISLEFRNQDASEFSWPFKEEITMTADNKASDGVFTVGSYSFPYHSAMSCMGETSHGWRLGTGAGTWVQLPAIAGYKLSKVAVVDSNANTAPVICTPDGTIVTGGSECIGFDKKKEGTFLLTGTEGNTAYLYKVTDASHTVRMLNLRLEYESASNIPTSGLRSIYTDAGGAKGVVFWVDPADDTKAKVISAWGEMKAWSTKATKTGAINNLGIADQIAAIKAAPDYGSADNVYAQTYCDALGEGWRLPSGEELMVLFNVYWGRPYDAALVASTFYDDSDASVAEDKTAARAAQVAFEASLAAAGAAHPLESKGANGDSIWYAREKDDGSNAYYVRFISYSNASGSKTGTARYVRCVKSVTTSK